MLAAVLEAYRSALVNSSVRANFSLPPLTVAVKDTISWCIDTAHTIRGFLKKSRRRREIKKMKEQGDVPDSDSEDDLNVTRMSKFDENTVDMTEMDAREMYEV